MINKSECRKLEWVLAACESELKTRPVLTGVHFMFKDDQTLIAECTDNYRMHRAKLSYKPAVRWNNETSRTENVDQVGLNFICEVKPLQKLFALKTFRYIDRLDIFKDEDGDPEFAVFRAAVGNKWKDVQCKIIEGKFPDVDAILPDENRLGKTEVTLTQALVQSLFKAVGNMPVTLNLGMNEGKAAYRVGVTSWYSNISDYRTTHSISFAVNASYLYDLTSIYQDPTLHIWGAAEPFLVRMAQDSVIAVIMPAKTEFME